MKHFEQPPEQHPLSQEPPTVTGFLGLGGLISPYAESPDRIRPATPEMSYHTFHEKWVARRTEDVFDATDALVAGWIGYDGNIREELKRRTPDPSLPYAQGYNIQALDPVLAPLIRDSIFEFKKDDPKDGSSFIYSVDCQNGRLTPSIYKQTPNKGYVEITAFLGSGRDNFAHAEFRRFSNRWQDERRLVTFTPDSINPDAPAHPLMIEEELFQAPRTQAFYEAVGRNGDVLLREGQHLSDAPLQTNIYAELRDITALVA